jgi:hypothetical protein
MQDVDLFLELAAIAGVFVGFGALIAVRGGGVSDTFEVAYMRGVVSMGLLTVVGALAPVTFGRYDLSEHEVWALSSVVLLVGVVGVAAAITLSPESRAAEMELPRRIERVAMAVWVLWTIAVLLTPIVILSGVAPNLEAALYFTVVVLILLWTAFLLLQMVFRRREAAAS